MADRRLQVFHAVAKNMSFTKAAESLFTTQSSVTFHIKQLEEHLNTRLLERGRGRIALTPAGRIVFDYAEKIMGLVQEMDLRMMDMTQDDTGHLSVGCSAAFAEHTLPGIMSEFRTHLPHVKFHVTVANSESIARAILSGALDLGFVESATHAQGIASRVCCHDEMWVICHPNSPLADQEHMDPAQCFDHPFIGREAGSGAREAFYAYLREQGKNPGELNMVIEASSPTAVPAMVTAGCGISIASGNTIAAYLRSGTLKALHLDPPLLRPLSVICASERADAPLISRFVTLSQARLSGTSLH
jgi:DNA-binding transcriptional LysR family regulator